MRAEIIAVGSEMLTADRVDTNSLWLTQQLNLLGVEVQAKHIIGDHRQRLQDAVAQSIAAAPLVILTGGLGPTEDDLTRDCVAAALGVAMHFEEPVWETIAERYRKFRRTVPEINRRQAWILDGAEALPNARGTAPGQWFTLPNGVALILLPGPPGEMKPMFSAECLPRLQRVLPVVAIATWQARVSGMSESELDSLISPVYTQYENPITTVLAKAGDIEIHLRAQCATQGEADQLVSELGAKIDALLEYRIYSHQGDPLEKVVGALLLERGETVATAESITGGMLGQRFTSVPGCSQWFEGAFVTYTNRMKASLLGLDQQKLDREGAVNEETAAAMANAARRLARSHWAVALTGVAGPDKGGEAHDPGTVYIAIASATVTLVRRMNYPAGDRERIRQFSAQTALHLLREAMQGRLI
jgi:nicotinamide-nucleotide amidase